MDDKQSVGTIKMNVSLTDTDTFNEAINIIAEMLCDERLPKEIREEYQLRIDKIVENLCEKQLKIK